MVRHKTLGKKYYKNRQKKYSKKTAHRRRATKRKRLGHRVAGMLKRLFTSKRAMIHPSSAPVTHVTPARLILSNSNRSRNSVDLPGTSSAHRNEPAIFGDSRFFHNSVLIREGAAALEEIYSNYYTIFSTTNSEQDKKDLYTSMFITPIRLVINGFPKKTDKFYETNVLETMRRLNGALDRFIQELETKADLITGVTNNAAHKKQLLRSIEILKEMWRNSHADQFKIQHL